MEEGYSNQRNTCIMQGHSHYKMALRQASHMIKILWPNKKISVFRVTGLKILGRVGTHIFFFWKMFFNKNNLCILKGLSKCINYFY